MFSLTYVFREDTISYMGTKETRQASDGLVGQGLVYLALHFLADQFKQWYSENRIETTGESIISLSPIVDQKGDLQIDRLGMTLINIEEERIGKAQDPYIKKNKDNKAEGYLKANPPIRINLELMFSAAFPENYDEALKHISYVIECFQGKNVYKSVDYPAVLPPIEKLTLNLLNKEFNQLHPIWTMIGAKYLPSVIYKAKLLVINSQQPPQEIAPIEAYDLSLSKK